MRKIVLTFQNVITKKEIHQYLKEKLDLPEYYGNNLDALYDCLTSLCEPTAVGFFPQVPENDDPNIELLLYLEKVKKVFLVAERDDDGYLAVFTENDIWNGEDEASLEEYDDGETEKEEGFEEDPDRILSDFFASLDPVNRKK